MSILKVDQIQDTAGKKILQNTGGVLQVVEGTRTTGTNTASSSYVDAGLSASISPTSSSSKVLVIVAAGFGNTSSSKNNNVRIVRGSTEVRSFSRGGC